MKKGKTNVKQFCFYIKFLLIQKFFFFQYLNFKNVFVNTFVTQQALQS